MDELILYIDGIININYECLSAVNVILSTFFVATQFYRHIQFQMQRLVACKVKLQLESNFEYETFNKLPTSISSLFGQYPHHTIRKGDASSSGSILPTRMSSWIKYPQLRDYEHIGEWEIKREESKEAVPRYV